MIPRYLMEPGGVRLISSTNQHTGTVTNYARRSHARRSLAWRVGAFVLVVGLLVGMVL